MWERTLIESKGYSRATKKGWTIPLAAFLHSGLIVAVIFASYWHVEAVEAPPSNVSYWHTIPIALTPPPLLGQRHRQSAANSNPKKDPPPQVTQPIEIPPLENSSNNETEQIGSELGDDPGSNLPEGDPNGVPDGDPTSTYPGGYGFAPPIDDEVHVINAGVMEPKLIKRVEPEYPRPALVARMEGVVILEAIITKTGSVEQVKTLRADHVVLEKAAREAVLQWKYKPATLNGQPIKVYFTVTVTFHLR